MSKTVVVALGGNAILQSKQEGTYENQLYNVKTSSKFLAKLIKEGYKLVITHGNGPQVGNILRQNEEAQDVVPPMPMDVLNGESQGFIGYMMVQSLLNELKQLGHKAPVVNLLTRVEVSKDDEDFKDPSKPIGPFYSEEEAKKLAEERNWNMKEDSNRGWRRVVPSPKPIKILEAQAIKDLAEAGNVVVACGGGGIPVVSKEDGTYEGIEAVIDKDRSGCKLAEEVNADVFMILTDVDNVFINFGKPDQKSLEKLTITELEAYVNAGHFAKGSMGPKVESALNFAKQAKATSIICSLEKVDQALLGKSGTIISDQHVEDKNGGSPGLSA
ncbi:carbamate kinase [Scopulibacillus darangshiensis]|uniref:Carbamate kinase n=1 Tax=Scopulibacillus darangshiensis TaxID=442528 RepID=A0A4V6NQG1_9BACL|nr:carbamate kinase [Scopulibacillus darangshiensis]TCP21666.1 carbamate kinase [Scopulibacillus darangshiensis]